MNIEKLSDKIFYSTIKIETKDQYGNLGSGTGFFIFKRIDQGHIVIFLVTNKHVIENTESGKLIFHEGIDEKMSALKGNEKIELELGPLDWSNLWFYPDDKDLDLVIAPIVPLITFIKESVNKHCYFQPIDLNTIPDINKIKKISSLEEIMFIGYPNGIGDQFELTPVIRRGHLSTPLYKDFNKKREFLIDASVFPGSSGSPVLIMSEGSFFEDNSMVIGNRLLFIGVVSAVYEKTQFNELQAVTIPTVIKKHGTHSSQTINLGIVIKAERVRELVDEFCLKKNIT
ncbi:trypsin-like peptidase domain-containing protein [Acinetobacter lwoffii]|jgi:hypothetical protein|uniref:S1 family peptidase n=1 Tax=Acinetobacter TaxID=469 RepID=UPI0008FFE703|nr:MULTISPECIES: serine protease [Acinetobacter]MRA04617.1 trypsin-like peptidase domain-containing protein [Acinetobacter lwoffii]OIU83078.1 hypothetical protein BFN00_12245 [Acinetobacter sp. AR2-3]